MNQINPLKMAEIGEKQVNMNAFRKWIELDFFKLHVKKLITWKK